MAPPVLVNTYVTANDKPYLDNVSKVFIISELPLGLTRLPLLGNLSFILNFLSVVYSFMVACYFLDLVIMSSHIYMLSIVVAIAFGQCVFFMVFNFISIKRMHRYYNELNVFDKEVGCRPKIGKATIRNILQTVVLLTYTSVLFALSHIIETLEKLYLGYVPFVLCHILEVHYIGHLLSLLIPRLRLINYYMEMSLSNSKITKTLNVEEFGRMKALSNKSLCKMENLMNLYHNMIKAYNYLIEAIKWQLLVTIVTSFINILFFCYKVSLNIIREEAQRTHLNFKWRSYLADLRAAAIKTEFKERVKRHDTIWYTGTTLCGIQSVDELRQCIVTAPLTYMITYVGVSAGIMLPLFAPCILGDQVHNEVRRLRELLASRLYENQLDKSSRGMARALLAWTETRDLSFSLMRMLDIDISLPFKFVGLLVTYLIILLQFQKVINP